MTMILFLEDWEKYPSAIVDTSTSNVSFVRIAGLYKSMGIKNHAFPLALHDPYLVDVDPWSNNLTQDEIIAIVTEAKENPWYFFREILKAPARGGTENPPIRANRANIAMWWLFNNHITQMVIQPRQTGKSLCADGNSVRILTVAANNTTISLLTKDDDLRTANIRRIKDLMENLPYYLKLKNRADSFNTEKITINRLGNIYQTAVGQAQVKSALNIGRGLTSAIYQIDEMPFIRNIQHSLPVMLAGGGAARDEAKIYNAPYGNIFTTTAGYLSTPEGQFGYKFYNDCLRWSEMLFDCENEEDLFKTIKKNSPSGKSQVLCEFNHRQLGYTDEWLKEKIEESMSQGENAEADFLNKWAEGSESSPIAKDILEKIVNSAIPDPIVRVTTGGYMIRWYVSEVEINNKLQNRQIIMGMDTSDAIGNDDIAMVMRDSVTGEIVGTGLYNETNLITFANWLVDILEEYPNITLVIERRSSGVTIIDNLLLLLPSRGIDPFKRIFNWVSNNADNNDDYRRVISSSVYGRDSNIYVKYRKEFGYATSSVGRASRDNLYGLAFNAATKYTCTTVRDKTLISQLSSLIRKNDRIDHREGEHDDMVIAWLLSYWFLTQAKNLSIYGLSARTILLTVNDAIIEEEGGVEAVMKKEQDTSKIREIESYMDKYKNESDPIKAEMLRNRIKLLYQYIDPDVSKHYNIESLMDNIKRANQFKLNDNMRFIF